MVLEIILYVNIPIVELKMGDKNNKNFIFLLLLASSFEYSINLPSMVPDFFSLELKKYYSMSTLWSIHLMQMRKPNLHNLSILLKIIHEVDEGAQLEIGFLWY